MKKSNSASLSLRGVSCYVEGAMRRLDLIIEEGRIVALGPDLLSCPDLTPAEPVLDGAGLAVFPGFCDLHVHFREPGQGYKETIASGALAAAHGGYTTVCPMPNLTPVPDNLPHLKEEEVAIDRAVQEAAREGRTLIRIVPYGSISQGEKGAVLSDMAALAPYVAAFSDDGVGVASEGLMKEAMRQARSLDKAIVAHAEDRTLVRGGIIHDGDYARRHGHPGNPSASEYTQVQRDLALAQETGVHYHVCHVSSQESVQAILAAKKAGCSVTFETAPHYLSLTDEDLQEEGRFRMNPPIRGRSDRAALRQALADGWLDAIATDHAPHSEAEKSGGLAASLNGVVGLETAFSVCYTDLVKTGLLPLARLVEVLSLRPYHTLRLKEVIDPRGLTADPALGLREGQMATLTLFDLSEAYRIDPKDFFSKGKSSPFTGKEVYGRCLLTLVEGEWAYQDQIRLQERRIHAGSTL